MPSVLIVDDDPAILEILRVYLRQEGFRVLEARDGTRALSLLPQADVAVLDWMLPGLTGLELARRAHATFPELPLLMLTARDGEEDKLRGLEGGADDYVTKPFSPREVVARVKVLLRRVGVREVIEHGELRLDVRARAATLRGEPLGLSKLEFDLLFTLAQYPGLAWTRERLLERVWGVDYPRMERVVDVHVTGLRRKLGDDAERPRYIETVRGVGYRFREDGQDESPRTP
ncbi:sensory transduction protein regX3 [Deinococcus carri]|uniref:Sensory transduction protein regX3 n=1 Tax=Deinococcus carri TaxID=1211323 RepID=A0ABP9W4R4_9DEIO